MADMDLDWKGVVLCEHFRLGEFAVSREHPQLAAEIRFSSEETERIRYLAVAYLQPLRYALGVPVIILSGKRTVALNAAVGGVASSDHLYLGGSAAVDLAVDGYQPIELVRWIAAHTPYWKQLIFYPAHGFVHLSLPDYSGKRREIREAKPDGSYPLVQMDKIA